MKARILGPAQNQDTKEATGLHTRNPSVHPQQRAYLALMSKEKDFIAPAATMPKEKILLLQDSTEFV